ncbi:MAG: amidinotransferase [Elusimicrobia bacterium]|nr:amidinotransferase [Elusimicrobiota bacterium]
MNTQAYAHINDLKGFSIKNCPPMPFPSSVLMCPPDYYDVLQVQNPFMAGHAGSVDRTKALAQWEKVRDAFVSVGKTLRTIPAVQGLEDMVFCSNQAFVGLTSRMEKVCLMSRMRYPSRRREVPHFESWFRAEGYRIIQISDSNLNFEAHGDCRWHPGKRLLWGGYGFRTDPEVYPEIADIFETPVVKLKLVNERFYHLDTCFCPLTHEAVLIYPPAFDSHSLELILKLFPIVLAAEEDEAVRLLACNAAVIDSKVAIVQRGLGVTARHMRAVGLEVVETDTSEFVKSGGSAYCISMPYF